MRLPERLRRLDDRLATGPLARSIQTERGARRLGNGLLAFGLAWVLLGFFLDGRFAGVAFVLALAGGLWLGRATEVQERRRGRGLRDEASSPSASG